jgi:hypothetical protein
MVDDTSGDHTFKQLSASVLTSLKMCSALAFINVTMLKRSGSLGSLGTSIVSNSVIASIVDSLKLACVSILCSLPALY